MKPLVDEADYVVVGTGAGGATAARVLAESGRSVLMMEEGPRLATRDRPNDLLAAMSLAFRDLATTTTRGNHPIPLLQGRCVGGSTAVNCGIFWRLPEDVRQEWTARWGLGSLVDPEALDRIFTRLEEELEVAPTGHDVLGGNGLFMERGSQALGLPGQPMRRNARSCRGRARCLQGCPEEARQSMDVSYVPRALAHGARLHTMSRADEILIRGGRAVGVRGTVLEPDTRRSQGSFVVRARRAVIVAGGAVQTPVLLRRSGLRGLTGDRFQAHPGTGIVARYEELVGMNRGATQGYEIPLPGRGFKLESLSIPAELLAARIPGAGREWEERLSNLDHFAQYAVIIRMDAMGKVRPIFGGKATVSYEPTDADLFKARDALALLCRLHFAAGAVEVYPGVSGVPEVMRSVDEVALLDQHKLRTADLHWSASHLFGTACASADPRKGVVGPDLQAHSVKDLYVMDSSAFPTNLGVNPQASIMAVAFRAAELLAERAHNRAA